MSELRIQLLNLAIGAFPGNSLPEIIAVAQTFADFVEGTAPAAKPAKTTKPKADPAPPADDEVDRELNAPVEPMPATGKAVVDAGTGQPLVTDEAPKQMTMAEVKAAAVKLAGVDTPKLGELIKKHGGTKLSDIPPANLGDFAGDVMLALG